MKNSLYLIIGGDSLEIKNNNKEINWKELQIINQKKFKLDDLYKVFCDGNIKKRLTANYMWLILSMLNEMFLWH